MTLLLLAYIGGVLTIFSPCILPVLPFVFARADRPFLRSGLPLLCGMAVTFALIAALAAVGGGWVVQANQYGRDAAIALMGLFGLALLFPALSNRLTRPLVAAGSRLSETADQHAAGGAAIGSSVLLGVATGLLWAPCAGPILGLILTGAALQGASVQTSFLLFAYALGAATSLAVALLAGGRVFAGLKRSLGAGEWIRRGLGVLVLAAVVAIVFGFDTGFLTRISAANTASLEQGLLDRFHQGEPSVVMSGGPTMMMNGGDAGGAMMNANPTMMMKGGGANAAPEALNAEGPMPSLDGAVAWLNSPPLTPEALKGKVVLIDFWTYSCINCLRAIPYVEAWAEKYKDQGLVVIGVHSPEFAFEKDVGNVRKAIADLKITYPVAVDSNLAIWRAFHNSYWPAHYFIDATGQIRHHHFGEGDYDVSELIIQKLLAEAGKDVSHDLVAVNAAGAEAPAAMDQMGSPETYIGYDRAENFVSPGGATQNARHAYTPGSPRLNEWGLAGDWTVGGEHATLDAANGDIVYRFHARDLHLVLGPGPDGKPVRFRVTLDGAKPADNHGVDIDADGNGTVTEQRLYQLIRQQGPVTDHTFEIQFLDPGVQAFSFTFG